MKDSEHPFLKQKIAFFSNGYFLLNISWGGARIKSYTLSGQPFNLSQETMSKCLCNIPSSEEDKSCWLWLSMTSEERYDFLKFLDEVDMMIYHLDDLASLDTGLCDYRPWMTVPIAPDSIDDLKAKVVTGVINAVNKKIEEIDIEKVKAERRYAGEARTKKIEELRNELQTLRSKESALQAELDGLTNESVSFTVYGEKNEQKS